MNDISDITIWGGEREEGDAMSPFAVPVAPSAHEDGEAWEDSARRALSPNVMDAAPMLTGREGLETAPRLEIERGDDPHRLGSIDMRGYIKPATDEQIKAYKEWKARRAAVGMGSAIHELFELDRREFEHAPAEVARRAQLERETGIPRDMMGDGDVLREAEVQSEMRWAELALSTSPASVVEFMRRPGAMEMARDDIEAMSAVGSALERYAASLAPDREGGIWSMVRQGWAGRAERYAARADFERLTRDPSQFDYAAMDPVMANYIRPTDEQLRKDADWWRGVADWIAPDPFIRPTGIKGYVGDVLGNPDTVISSIMSGGITLGATALGAAAGGPAGAAIGNRAGAAFSSWLMSHGEAQDMQIEAWEQLVERGMDPIEARRQTYYSVYLPNLALLSATNYIENVLAFGAPIAPVGPGAMGWIRGFGKTLLHGRGDPASPFTWLQRGYNFMLSAGMEGFEEVAQGLIGNRALGDENDWGQLLYEGAVGMGSGLLFQGVGAGMRNISGRYREHRQKVRAASVADRAGAILDEAMKAAAASKVRERSPETFAEFVEGVQGEDGGKVFIDAGTFREKLSGQDVEAAARALGVTDEDFAEALGDGGAVELSTAELMQHQEIYDAIKDGIRFEEDGMSRDEAAEFERTRDAEFRDEVDRYARALQVMKESGEAAERVRSDIQSKILSVGHEAIGDEEATLTSVVYTAMLANEARALGQSIEDRYKAWNMTFVYGYGGAQPTAQEAEAAALDPTAGKYVDEAEGSVNVPLSRLRITETLTDEGRASARRNMEEAIVGQREKRAPLTVVDRGDGTYAILDGNNTYAELKDLGAESVPVSVLPGPYQKDVTDMDGLYAKNAEAEGEFHSLMAALHEELGGELIERQQMKDRERAAQKIASDYGGDPRFCVDVWGGSLVFETEEELLSALEKLRARGDVVRIKDKWHGPDATGYRDVNMNIRLSNGAVVEMQLHLKGVMEVKESVGHSLYEFMRANKDKEEMKPAVKQTMEISRILYAAGIGGTFAHIDASLKASLSEMGRRLINQTSARSAEGRLKDLSGMILKILGPSASDLTMMPSSSVNSTANGTSSPFSKYRSIESTSYGDVTDRADVSNIARDGADVQSRWGDEGAGASAKVRTVSGTEIGVRYRVVGAGDLVASHGENGGVNEAYPKALQPRDRSREASIQQIHRMAAALDPELLGENRMASDGAPIVGADGVVESGNGRVMAIRRAYRTKTAGQYRTWMIENAEKFGLTKEEVKAVREPVLIRERTSELSDADRVKFVQEANQSSVSRMSKTEQALADAQRLTQGMLASLDPDADIASAANREFVQQFISLIVGEGEMNTIVDARGDMSQGGKERITNALFAYAYGDTETLSRLRETLDDDTKNVTAALLGISPRMADLESKMRHGGLHAELSIREALMEAANKLAQLKRDGEPVARYLDQGIMFDAGDISPEARAILRFLDERKRSAKGIREGLTRYADMVEAEGSPDQLSMFGEGPRSREELIREAFAHDVEAHRATAEEAAESYPQLLGERGAASLDAADAGRRMDDLAVAREMEEAGKDAKAIRLATGWERGADGKWRFEIPDGTVREDFKIEGDETTLGAFFDAPELYAAYPELADMPVLFVASTGSGSYAGGAISLDPGLLKSGKDRAKDTLVHEVQHAIQDIEGFAQGGSQMMAWGDRTRGHAAREYQRLREKALALPSFEEYIEGAWDGEDTAESRADYEEYVKDNEAKRKKMPSWLDRILQEEAARNVYHGLSGEVEARNASTRMDMTAEERRAQLLRDTEDVAREDQIVLREALGVAMASLDGQRGLDGGELRGQVDFIRKGKGESAAQTIIRIFKEGDRSTLLHESGHIFLESMRRLSLMEGLDEGVMSDWETLKRWLEIEDLDFSLFDLSQEERKALTPEQRARFEADKKRWQTAQEKFAAGFEKYLMGGKAPTNELAKAFRAFKKWLTDIYRALRNIVYVDADGNEHQFEISGEVREVMDRLLASEEEIEASRAVDDVERMARIFQERGIPDDVRKKYEDLATNGAEAAKLRLFRRIMEELEPGRRKEREAARKKARPEAEAAVRELREYKTLGALTRSQADGGLRISAQDLARYGEAAASVPEGVTSETDGLSVEDAAGLLGYDGADALIEDLRKAKETPLESAIEARVREATAAQESLVRDRKGMKEAAERALHGGERLDQLILEAALLLRSMEQGEGQQTRGERGTADAEPATDVIRSDPKRSEAEGTDGAAEPTEDAESYGQIATAGQDQTRTAAFKEWFGDWEADPKNASKVVDEDGRPLVVYHGTTRKKGARRFRAFDAGGKPFWFTPAKNYAAIFSRADEPSQKGDLYPVFLNMRNPLDVGDISFGGSDTLEKLAAKTGISIEELRGLGIEDTSKTWKVTNDARFRDLAMSKGYDGMIAREAGVRSYAVFSPTQIKSATDNRGTFDAGDADIYHQSATAEQKLAQDEEAWGDGVDGVLNGTINSREHVKVMETPLVLTLIGAKPLPVYMNASKISEVLAEHQGMTPEILKQIPRAISDPVAIFTSKTHPNDSIVVMTEIADADGATVIVPVTLDVAQDEYRINKISSTYGKDNAQWFVDQVNDGRLLYIDRQKSSRWSVQTGLQLPVGPTTANGQRIADEADLVKAREENKGYYQAAAPDEGQGTEGPARQEQPEADGHREGGQGGDDLTAWIAATRKAAIESAQAKIERKKIRALSAARYMALERQAADRGLVAMREGKTVDALYWKRREIILHALAREALMARSEVDKAERVLKRFWPDRKKLRASLGDEAYEQIAGLLSRVGILGTDPRGEGAPSLRAYLEEIEQQSGSHLLVADWIRDLDAQDRRARKSELTLAQFRDVMDAQKIIQYMARREKQLLTEARRKSFEEVVAQLRAVTVELHGEPPPASRDPDVKDGGVFAGVVASLDRVETLLRKADGLKDQGAWWDTIYRPVQRAYDDEVRRGEKMRELIDAVFKKHFPDKKELSRFLRGSFDTGMKDPATGEPIRWTMENLLAAMLNWGNAHNRARLVWGQGLVEHAVGRGRATPGDDAQYHLMTEMGEAALEEIFKARATEKMWDFCQDVWDALDTLWPDIAKLEREMTGKAPERVEPSPVRTAGGRVLRGGYYPVRFNTKADWQSFVHGEQETVKALYEDHFHRPQTRHGHTKERVKRVAPRQLLLSLDVIGEHVANVVHDLTHRPVVRDLYKLTRDERVRDLLIHAVGRRGFEQFDPWIQSLAAPTIATDPMDRMFSRMMGNAAAVQLGLNKLSMIGQIVSLVPAAWKLGPARAIQAVLETISLRGFWDGELRRWAFEKSPELRDRINGTDRDLRVALAMDRASRGRKLVAGARAALYAGLGWADMMISIPVWHAAYAQGMARWGDEQRAVDHANYIVRTTNNAGAVKDMAQAQRGNALKKLFTMYYSAFGSLYQMFREECTRAGMKGLPGKARLAAFCFAVFVVQSALEDIVKGRGPWDDDDDDELSWGDISAWLLRGGANTFASMFPVVRDIASGTRMLGGSGEYRPSPALDAGGAWIRAIDRIADTVADAWEGEDVEGGKLFRDITKAGGYAFGLPTVEMFRWYKAFVRWMDDAPDFSPLELIWPKRGR